MYDMDPSIHEKAMTQLCFVCGQIMDTKNTIYQVENNLDMLSRTLKETVVVVPGVTPMQFCYKCYSTLRKVEKMKTVKMGSRKQFLWKECSLSCESCEMFTRCKKPGRKKKVCARRIYVLSFCV